MEFRRVLLRSRRPGHRGQGVAWARRGDARRGDRRPRRGDRKRAGWGKGGEFGGGRVIKKKRRNKRCSGEWSSDVCSCDLADPVIVAKVSRGLGAAMRGEEIDGLDVEIGRGPGGGRGESSGGAGSLKKKEGIRDVVVNGVQTCALAISPPRSSWPRCRVGSARRCAARRSTAST